MCGITGYYSPNKYESKPNSIIGMTDLIRHRGPDDVGYTFIDTRLNSSIDASDTDSPKSIKEKIINVNSLNEVYHNLAFGHRRYAIVDLSPAGHQPYWDENNSVCVCINGEIYNYIELKKELEERGHKFISESDTEVVVKAYLEWGVDCFEKFNGTWALSLYDSNKNKLLLSRDRIGKNPLYYTILNNVLYWSSEIKSLLYVCGIDAFAINEQAIFDYINYGIRDFDNNTFWKEIYTFPAATFAWVDESLSFQNNVYWTIPKKRMKSSEISFEDAKNQFRKLLTDALNIRLRSDIPIGFTLSGGLDSSSLLALFTQELKKSTVSFTVEFPEKGANEEPFARMVAEKCGKNVEYKVIKPLDTDFWKEANNYIWIMEEPFHSPNLYADYTIQKELKSQGFGAMINGAAGDELLAGYENMYSIYILNLFNNEKFKLITEFMSFNSMERLIKLMIQSINNIKKKIFNQNRLSFLTLSAKTEERHFPKNFDERMIGNMGSWLMNYWLRSGNKSYFLVPMESRAPFLDYNLIDFVYRLPSEYLIKNGWHKFILRKAIEDLLPKKVVWRKRKMGFPFPYQEWLKSSKVIILQNLMTIDCPYVSVKQLFDKYDYLTESNSFLLWRYVSLLLWWKRVIKNEPIVYISTS